MDGCVRAICGHITGRRSSHDDCLLDATCPQAALHCRSLPAEPGLQRLQAIQQQCSVLGPELAGLRGAAAESSSRALRDIRGHLDQLEAILQAHRCGDIEDARCSVVSTQAGSDALRLSEVSEASSVDSASEHLQLNTGAIAVRRLSIHERFAAFCRCAWCRRRSVVAGQHGRRVNGGLETPVFESAPQAQPRVAENACVAARPEAVNSDSECAEDPTSLAGCPILAEFKSCLGPPKVQATPIVTQTFPDKNLSLDQVWQALLRSDDEWPVMKVWQMLGVTVLSATPWEPLGAATSDGEDPGFLRRLHLRLPLKPQPLAPKSTRITVVYHIRRYYKGELVVLTDQCRSWDVPYGKCFDVQGQLMLRHGPEGGTTAAKFLGIRWYQRVMVRSIIERAVKNEATEFFWKLADVMPGAGVSLSGEANF